MTITSASITRLVLQDDALRIRYKRVTLDMTSLRPASDVAVIL